MYSHLPTIFHVTHHKAGSQWIYGILRDAAPERVVTPHLPWMTQVLHHPIMPGMIYPNLYLSRAEFEVVSLPTDSIIIAVIRDLRDTLISWYFSMKYSHHVTDPFITHKRAEMNESSFEDGLRREMIHFLPNVARIQLSWVNSFVHLVRYEDLVADELNEFGKLFDHIQLDISSAWLKRIVEKNSFEQRSGRQKGTEDIHSHYRKGIVGDWKNFLKGPLLAEFKGYFDDVLIETGYESSHDWGLDNLPRVYQRAERDEFRLLKPLQIPDSEETRECWCSGQEYVDFSPEYRRCRACGTLVYKYPFVLPDVDPSLDDEAESGLTSVRVRRVWTTELIWGLLSGLLKYEQPGAKVLVFPAKEGALVEVLAKAGFDALGVEADSELYGFASQRSGVPVHHERQNRKFLQPGDFDAILVNQIELFSDPLKVMKRCAELLKPDGALFFLGFADLVEENFDTAKTTGTRLYTRLKPAKYPYLFSKAALDCLIERAGYDWQAGHQVVDMAGRTDQTAASELVLNVVSRRPMFECSDDSIVDRLLSTADGRSIVAALDLHGVIRQRLREKTGEHQNLFDQINRMHDHVTRSFALQSDVLTLGHGWYPLERYEGATFCWVGDDAEIVIHSPSGMRSRLYLDVNPGPGVGCQPFTLQVRDFMGQVMASAWVEERQMVYLPLPITPGLKLDVVLHVEGGGEPIAAPNDPRTLNFQVFQFGLI